MSSWTAWPMASLDLETTGLDVATDRIVSAALWRIDPYRGTKRLHEWLADPGVPIPVSASGIHGITTEQARREGRPAVEVLFELATHLRDAVDEGCALVVYNAPYDLTLLSHELARHGLELDWAGQRRVVDPLVLDRHCAPERVGRRNLAAVCGHYGVPLAEHEAHTAAGDALAAARLAWRLGRTHSAIADLTLSDLHAGQIRWFADQAAALQTRLRRTRDPDATVDPRWPLRPVAVASAA